MLIMEAVQRIKASFPHTKIGARGQLCGDKDSVAFFEQAGFDFISCPTSSLDVAKVAAAHARVEMLNVEATEAAREVPFGQIRPLEVEDNHPRLSTRLWPASRRYKQPLMSSRKAVSTNGVEMDKGTDADKGESDTAAKSSGKDFTETFREIFKIPLVQPTRTWGLATP